MFIRPSPSTLIRHLALALAAASLAACSTNPTTGRSQLPGLSRNEEVSIGLSEGPKLTQEFGGESKNPALRAYINEIGQRLKEFSDRDLNGNPIADWDGAPPGSQRRWTFTLLDSDVINAFALPGEQVFMSQGLADKMTNEAQLAGVLGHEIGHVMARHTAERFGNAMVGQGLLAIGGIFAGGSSGGKIAMEGGQLLVGGTLLKFSRDQESEADRLGMRYMSLAGYNPAGQRQVMEILKAAAGDARTPEILATHPLPQTRIDEISGLLNGPFAFTQSGPLAKDYQFHEDRFRQRYLALRQQDGTRSVSPSRPAPDTTRRQLLPGRRRSHAAPHAPDSSPPGSRRRLLASVVLEDPTTWCLVCMNAPDQH